MRSDSTTAKPTPRENWIEQSTEPRSPADVDYLTWQPIEEWKQSRFAGLQQPGGASAFDRRPRLSDRPRRTRKSKPTLNPHYRGSRAISEREIRDALREIRDQMDSRLLPGLLAAILMNRQVQPERIRTLIAARFGRAPDDGELVGLISKAVAEVETQLEGRLGFLPKYQLRWVGLV